MHFQYFFKIIMPSTTLSLVSMSLFLVYSYNYYYNYELKFHMICFHFEYRSREFPLKQKHVFS